MGQSRHTPSYQLYGTCYTVRDTILTSQMSEENKGQTTSRYGILWNTRYICTEIARNWGRILGHNYENSIEYFGTD